MAKKLSKGTPVRGNLSASFFNELNKMRREWRGRGSAGGGELPGVIQQRSVVWVKSIGGLEHDPVDAGGIMMIHQSPSSPPASSAWRTFKAGNPTPMLREPIIPVRVPQGVNESLVNVRCRRFVVLIDRLVAGGVARAVMQGPTYAKVKLHAQSGFKFVQVAHDESAHLEQAPTGYAELLMREEGDPGDVVDALILIGGQPTSLLVKTLDAMSSASTLVRCEVCTTGTPSSVTDFKLIALPTHDSFIAAGIITPVVYRQNLASTDWLIPGYFPLIPS